MPELKKFVKNVMNESIKKDYPHLRIPSAVLAVVTRAEETAAGGKYRLRILDQNGQADETIPEIPDVQSSLILEQGDKVCVLLLYGQLWAYIAGRYLV